MSRLDVEATVRCPGPQALRMLLDGLCVTGCEVGERAWLADSPGLALTLSRDGDGWVVELAGLSVELGELSALMRNLAGMEFSGLNTVEDFAATLAPRLSEAELEEFLGCASEGGAELLGACAVHPDGCPTEAPELQPGPSGEEPF